MATAAAAPPPPQGDHRYTVDIRVFVAMIVTAMAISFGIGVGMGPSATDFIQAANQQQASTAALEGGLPKVTSINLDAPLGKPTDDLHEPAGQVRIFYATC